MTNKDITIYRGIAIKVLRTFGLNTTDIAKIMNLSRMTVHNHINKGLHRG